MLQAMGCDGDAGGDANCLLAARGQLVGEQGREFLNAGVEGGLSAVQLVEHPQHRPLRAHIIIIVKNQMENSSRFGLEAYYRDLVTVEKSLSLHSAKAAQLAKPRSFLKQKSELPKRKTPGEETGSGFSNERHSYRLSLATRNNEQASRRKQESRGIPDKYLQNIQQSLIMIKKQGAQSSAMSKEENQKIILQIHGLQGSRQSQQSVTRVMRKDKTTKSTNELHSGGEATLKKFDGPHPQMQKQRSIRVEVVDEGQCSTNAVKLVEKLKERNRIYELVASHSESPSNLEQQFEKMWGKFKLFERFAHVLRKVDLSSQ